MSNNKKSKEKKQKHRGRRIFGKIVLILLLIIIILAGIFAYKVYKNGGGLTGIVTTLVGTDPEKVKSLPDFYCLLLGKSEAMTDTIMVAKYSPSTGEAALLSIPRDSFVGKNPDTATASDKINSKYQISPQRTIDAVNDLTGLNLKYYITVDTKALRDLVDAIGGVYFDVPIKMDYDDSSQDLYIHLEPGYQLLDGQKAEWLVRFRHNNNGTSYSYEYGDNDLGRMRTQREFLMAVAKQTLKLENITKINDILNVIEQEVETNIDFDTMMEYAPALLNINADNIQTGMLPGVAQYCNGVAVYLVNEKEAKELVNELFLTSSNSTNGEDGTSNTISNETSVGNTNKVTSGNTNRVTSNTATQKNFKVEILNGTGSQTKLNQAIDQLEAQGYKVAKKGNTNITSVTTVIDRTNNSVQDENAITALLGTGKAIMGEDNSKVDFTIILGRDY